MKQGIFYGVGIGPGDPELITRKAVRILESCLVIAAPQTGGERTLALEIARQAADLSGKTIVTLPFAMSRDREKQRAAHEAAVEAIVPHLREGRDVAMLNLGDVSIYATYGYLMGLIQEQGFETEMIPGVPSFCAAAARLGISLTEMNQPLHILPAGGCAVEEELALTGTKVLMKSGKRLPQVVEALKADGRLEKSSAVLNCGLPGEQVYRDLTELPEDPGYFLTVIVKG